MDSSSTPGLLAVRSTLLRSVLLLELHGAAGRTLTVGELCAGLERRGFTVRGRAGKVVSDALRVELSKGRVYRPARDRYRVGRLPGTTRWRCRQRVREALAGRAPAIHLARPARPRRPARAARPARPARVRLPALDADRAGPQGVVVARRRNTGDGTTPRPADRRRRPAAERSRDHAARVAPGTRPARAPPP